MDSTINPEISKDEVKIALNELREVISRLDEKIGGISSRLDVLSETLLPEDKPEIVGYMQITIDAMVLLDEINQGIPVSRLDLANKLEIHPNTAYIRAEKLVRKKSSLLFIISNSL